MRRTAFLLLTFCLAGCGRPQTPLSHAIEALRAADHNALVAAHQEADAALKSAIPADSDLCMLTGDDIRKYSEAARVAKLNDTELLGLPEEDRLLYALKIAGPPPKITDDPRLMRAPLYRAMTDWEAMRNCKQVPNSQVKLDAGSVMAAQTQEDGEEARSGALQDWMNDLRSRHGAEFESRMRSAVNHLGNAGYTAPWPPEAELVSGDAPQQIPTFQQVQDRLRDGDQQDAKRRR